MVRALLIVLLAMLAAGPACAEPGARWDSIDPKAAGWSADGLERARGTSAALGSTALVIVRDGKLVAGWGDPGRKVNLRSVRKSLLSALYGIAVAEGRINPESTLAALGIDDKPPSLSAGEKQATVRDLLMARSGVYHPAAYETGEMRDGRPARGSHPPGSHWFYNNWDFNALGTIYRRQTGKDIFQSFAQSIARPIGMEDFSERDGRLVLEGVSIHPAYPFTMSARDAARFGLLILQGGRWRDRQLIPAEWIMASTAPLSQTDRGRQHYGYLWWVLPQDQWGAGAVLASGYGGQAIAILPAKRLVVVQTVDPTANRRGVRISAFLDLLRTIAAAAP